MRTRTRRIVLGTALAALTLAEGVAFADDREQCASSAEQAQQLRDEGKYRRAREQMLFCARDVCPGPIKSDCGKWLTEVDRDAPTVVFGARDRSGGDVSDVKVTMDGAVIAERIDGKPVLVDSGEHTFKFETKDGVVKEEKVLLRAAEKARPIIATLPVGSGPDKGGGGGGGGNAGPQEEGSLVPTFIVGGIGLAAIGSFAGFGLAGKGAVDDLQTCKPHCAEADVDSARTKLIIADISLAVGVVALGVATYMFFTRPKVEAKVQTGSTWRFDAGPVAGGAVGSFGAKF
jgi:hypothetical protein